MKLTEEQRSNVLSNLNNFTEGKRVCTICANNKWALNDTIFEMREFNNGNLVLGGGSAIMPVVSISCTRCGNTQFISAIKMGVISPSIPDVNKETEEE